MLLLWIIHGIGQTAVERFTSRNVGELSCNFIFLFIFFSIPKRHAKNKASLCADTVTHVAHLPLCVTRGCQEREGGKKTVKYENNGLRLHEYLKCERQKGSKWFVVWALRCSVLVPLWGLFFKTPNAKTRPCLLWPGLLRSRRRRYTLTLTLFQFSEGSWSTCIGSTHPNGSPSGFSERRVVEVFPFPEARNPRRET